MNLCIILFLVQVSAGVLSKKCRDRETTKNLNNSYILAGDESQNLCLEYDSVDAVPTDHKGCSERTTQCVLETIFSPAFHISKDVGGGIPNRSTDVTEIFRSEDQIDSLECGMKESEVDSLVTVEISDSCGNGKQKISSKNMIGELPSICANDMNVDSVAISTEESALPNFDGEDIVGGNISSEVSAIYLAMQHSKLECVDEPSDDSMSTNVSVEADEGDEIDDFDPYLFIRNLPELSAVVPTFRPMLLPKQTRSCPPTTLVLDLDETLVHSTLEQVEDADFTFPVNFNFKVHTVYVRCRPHLKDFMERVAGLFEIIVFTASQSIYAEQLLNVLDPKRKIFRHRVYRESCLFVDGNYLKDLSILGRDLARVIIIDNSPQAFGFQVDNGIPIESWFDDRLDQELLSLLPFLESLVGVEDVRPLIAKKFNLREKVATAVNPSLN
ncbi:uncharacterized protein LOC143890985 [Tasmannia lanceolata]|uniref:uncharacterized protein LOC143890985 n=1 Tax=Tasmannia lanceolata TaxID=3420 RepID=UPI00406478AE